MPSVKYCPSLRQPCPSPAPDQPSLSLSTLLVTALACWVPTNMTCTSGDSIRMGQHRPNPVTRRLSDPEHTTPPPHIPGTSLTKMGIKEATLGSPMAQVLWKLVGWLLNKLLACGRQVPRQGCAQRKGKQVFGQNLVQEYL